MPISPNPNTNSNHVEDRRGSSPKRQNDILSSDHPVVTKAVYDAIVRGDGADENLEIKALCQAKNGLGKTLLFVDSAIRRFTSKKQSTPTHNALRQVRKEIEKAYLKFPLTITNK